MRQARCRPSPRQSLQSLRCERGASDPAPRPRRCGQSLGRSPFCGGLCPTGDGPREEPPPLTLVPVLPLFFSSKAYTLTRACTHVHTRAHALLSLLAQVACSLPIPAGSRSSLCARVLRGGLCPHLVPLGCGGDACCAFPEGLEFKLSLKQGWEGWKTGWGLRQVRATVCSAPKILCDLSSFSRKQ